jgi:hypothetical protein
MVFLDLNFDWLATLSTTRGTPAVAIDQSHVSVATPKPRSNSAAPRHLRPSIAEVFVIVGILDLEVARLIRSTRGAEGNLQILTQGFQRSLITNLLQ